MHLNLRNNRVFNQNEHGLVLPIEEFCHLVHQTEKLDTEEGFVSHILGDTGNVYYECYVGLLDTEDILDNEYMLSETLDYNQICVVWQQPHLHDINI